MKFSDGCDRFNILLMRCIDRDDTWSFDDRHKGTIMLAESNSIMNFNGAENEHNESQIFSDKIKSSSGISVFKFSRRLGIIGINEYVLSYAFCSNNLIRNMLIFFRISNSDEIKKGDKLLKHSNENVNLNLFSNVNKLSMTSIKCVTRVEPNFLNSFIKIERYGLFLNISLLSNILEFMAR